MLTDASARVFWEERDDDYAPWIHHADGSSSRAGWAPQAGSQSVFLASPVFETAIEGPRGTAKSTALLADFAQDVGKGLGTDWRGVMFRQSYNAFDTLIEEAKGLFNACFKDVKFKQSKGDYEFLWPDGESLRLMRFQHRREFPVNFQGQQFVWVGFDELTNWPDPSCFLLMFSCVRTKNPRVRARVRSAFNPGGVGHNWVKKRYRLPVAPGSVVGEIIQERTPDPAGGPDQLLERTVVHSELRENKVLLRGTPNYVANLYQQAKMKGGRHVVDAWIHGSWNIVAGGMFDDVWEDRFNRVPDVPMTQIPRGWRLDRNYDHGSSAPFSVGWVAESNGEPSDHAPWLHAPGRPGSVRGDLIMVAEWYGTSGQENEGLRMRSSQIGRGIRDREDDWGVHGRILPGVADSSIFDDYEPGKTVAADMAQSGVRWEPADKGPGSRKHGWERMREMIDAAKPGQQGERTKPGLFVAERCRHALDLLPSLPRDEKDPDDANTDAEDHIADMLRYRVRAKRRGVTVQRHK